MLIRKAVLETNLALKNLFLILIQIQLDELIIDESIGYSVTYSVAKDPQNGLFNCSLRISCKN